MNVLSRLAGGEAVLGAQPPEFVIPLAGAYVIAASEWLDFDGAASPAALLSSHEVDHAGWIKRWRTEKSI